MTSSGEGPLPGYILRAAVTEDHPRVVRAVQDWWGDSRDPAQARELSLLLPRLFLQHFAGTSLVVERDDDLIGFLVGFHSPDRQGEAYAHFIGVAPSHRRRGIARLLYQRFFEQAIRAGRTVVRAVTSPQNAGSIAFHRSLGFAVEGAGATGETPVVEDYDGPCQSRVCFVIYLQGA